MVTVPWTQTAFMDSEIVDRPPTSTIFVTPALFRESDLAISPQEESVL